jgi:hypothetical protein
MTRSAALFLLLLPAACADTQSGRAFIPRQASEVVVVVATPNKSADRDRQLADSLDRSLKEEEAREAGPLQEMMADKGANYAPPAKADRAPVASFR